MILDTWNVDTFDDELMARLHAHRVLIGNYFTTERQQFLEREAASGWLPAADNPFTRGYLDLLDDMGEELSRRTIRAWHFARLTDDEVAVIQTEGIWPGTLDTLRRRLDMRVKAGTFTAPDADSLYAASPCHHPEQQSGRLGKFWMSSVPIAPDDDGVEPVLGQWGGEATYFWLEDERLTKLLATIGMPRILELAVPMAKTGHSFRAAKDVVAAYARSLGCRTDRAGFDLYCVEPLGPEAILTIHHDGDITFSTMGRSYPEGFEADADA